MSLTFAAASKGQIRKPMAQERVWGEMDMHEGESDEDDDQPYASAKGKMAATISDGTLGHIQVIQFHQPDISDISPSLLYLYHVLAS